MLHYKKQLFVPKGMQHIRETAVRQPAGLWNTWSLNQPLAILIGCVPLYLHSLCHFSQAGTKITNSVSYPEIYSALSWGTSRRSSVSTPLCHIVCCLRKISSWWNMLIHQTSQPTSAKTICQPSNHYPIKIRLVTEAKSRPNSRHSRGECAPLAQLAVCKSASKPASQ